MSDSVRGPQHTFLVGEYVGARFRIVRFIAQGGMGEVYEADDLELGERIALKTILPEVANQPELMARFKQEIQLARKVTHPNVCRVFDIAVHAQRDGTEVTFLTMELLDGETLSEYMRKRGPLSVDAALPLVRQIVAGLAAAHEAGVIHRDLKGANVILLNHKNGGAPRAVLTDFGLARKHVPRPSSAVTTSMATKEFVGTPEYMAPEQVEGKAAGPPADIYALGVLLFEMLSGRMPFENDTPMALAVMRLHVDPPPVTRFAPKIPARWSQVIERCLQRKPKDRFARVEDVLAALEPPSKLRPRTRLQWAAALVLLVLSLAGAWFWYQNIQFRNANARRSIAVMGFRNLSGQASQQWLSTALAEMLSAELGQTASLRLIPGEAVARVKVELALGEQESFTEDSLRKLRRNLGGDVLVNGSYAVVGEPRQIRLNLLLQDVDSGEVLKTVSTNGAEAELFDLVVDAGRQLREALRPGEAIASKRGRTTNLAAMRHYAEGLIQFRRFDALAARESLMKAVEADPNYASAHAALADAHGILGYEGKAKQEAQRAFELAKDLPRSEQLLIEGRYREAARDFPGAERIYETLARDYPDEREHSLRLIQVLVRAGKSREALARIEELRKADPVATTDPRVYIAEASAADTLSNTELQLRATERGLELAKEQSAALAEARLLLLRGIGKSRTSERGEAIGLYRQGAEIYQRLGDEGGLSRALNNMGSTYMQLADTRRARELYEQSMEIKKRIGDARGAGLTAGNLGLISRSQGRLKEAIRMFQYRQQTAKEAGDRPGIVFGWQNIADAYNAMGEIDLAIENTNHALTEARAIQRGQDIGIALTKLAQLSMERLQWDAARKYAEESLSIDNEIKGSVASAQIRSTMARLLLERGDREGGERYFQEALKVLEKSGMRREGITLHVLVAEFRMDAGRWADAAKHLDESLAIAADADVETTQIAQLAMLAYVKHQMGKTAEARELAEKAIQFDAEMECRRCVWSTVPYLAVVLGKRQEPLARRMIQEMMAKRATWSEAKARKILADTKR
jgi:tetratricopeptide (TPR) repeat protein/tRNA A-37 threonylcarbamoyl transferase component Bud32